MAPAGRETDFVNENYEELGERKDVVEENRKNNVGISIIRSNFRLLENVTGKFPVYTITFLLAKSEKMKFIS